MALRSIADLVNAENNGSFWFTSWRKNPTQITGAGIWFDLSMSPGNPVPNYYAASPNIAVPLKQSTDGGIPHGGNVNALGYTKYLKQIVIMSNTANAAPLPSLLCDYLLYYPFVDMSITDEQFLVNTETLPRSVTGQGVRILPVEVAGQSGVGNPQFRVTYTNSNGVSGRVTPTVSCNTQLVNGTVITSSPATALSSGPFLPLQAGDTGVRSIDSVQFLSADTGLIAFVLVKPIEHFALRTLGAPMERNTFVDVTKLPIIEDDAYLNVLVCPQASLASVPLHGTATFVWG